MKLTMRPIMLAGAALLLAACTQAYNNNVTLVDPKTGQPVEGPETAAVLLKSFPDIPIPASHKLDLEHSLIFRSPTQTLGKLASEGSGDVDTIYHFYAKQMPDNGWHLVNSFQSSTSSLYFAKPGKFAAIIIEATGRNSSRVNLNVGPE